MAKSPNAFRTISEAAEAVGAPQHVLRFWETKFPFVMPVKRAGGRRFYRPHDIVVLKAIRRLLHDEGLTIKGVQRLHKEQGLTRLAAYGDADAAFSMDAQPGASPAPSTEPVSSTSGRSERELRGILADLESARARMDAVLAG
ncbi:MAG: MerR family transcriptional regulator [Brevundimonas subvibrioides]|uniref:MerR family transcriptional regulator n=1 Tax=Brevundimonas subvibrioides TaxID=74313 RepID=A0A258HKQ7_9CAUL|nr:MerR family transcriptional regulator [Brevundimonas subvibrioides]OYX56883.1 MAG: MerR family transcriptional regulator [Brevundimonas subvibrioides]